MRDEIGVFCGTFNPIHWGHLLMAEFARAQAALTKVIFITSPNPPHRHSDILDAEQRHGLVSEAVAGTKYFESSRIELERSGTSFTIDTLRQLQADNADCNLNLIIGQDNLQYIGKWKESAEIFRLARILVAPRNKQIVKNADPQETAPLPASANIQYLELPHIDVSSSDIRKRLREQQPVLYMVPPKVDRLLHEKRLYVK